MVEFIKWCFRNEDAGATTIFVLIILGTLIVNIIRVKKED